MGLIKRPCFEDGIEECTARDGGDECTCNGKSQSVWYDCETEGCWTCCVNGGDNQHAEAYCTSVSPIFEALSGLKRLYKKDRRGNISYPTKAGINKIIELMEGDGE